jgi:multiple sugar transport system permease protein
MSVTIKRRPPREPRAAVPARTGKPLRRENPGLDFVSPALLIILIFVVLPCIAGIALSFTYFDAIAPAHYIGTSNYARMAQDPLIATSLWNTLYYVLLTLPTGLVLALTVAVVLHQRWFVGRDWMQGVYFLPNVTSLVATAFVWEWMLNPEYGLVNSVLRSFGVAGKGWLSDPALAMPCVAAVGVWSSLGFGVLVYLAGLRSISDDVFEAARLDGASAWQQFLHVTWPLLTPTTMFLTMMGVIGGFQVFQSVYIMTGGGPLDRTRVYLHYLWQTAFQGLEMGYASAMAVVLFVIVLILTLIQWRFFQRRLSTWQ